MQGSQHYFNGTYYRLGKKKCIGVCSGLFITGIAFNHKSPLYPDRGFKAGRACSGPSNCSLGRHSRRARSKRGPYRSANYCMYAIGKTRNRAAGCVSKVKLWCQSSFCMPTGPDAFLILPFVVTAVISLLIVHSIPVIATYG